MTNIVKVPKTPKSAFNPKRPPSNLVMAQIAMMEAALKTREPAPPAAIRVTAASAARATRMAAARAVAAPVVKLKSEGSAAARVEELQALLLKHPDPVIPRMTAAGPEVSRAAAPARRRKQPASRPKRKVAPRRGGGR
jgi:hypothetical protein